MKDKQILELLNSKITAIRARENKNNAHKKKSDIELAVLLELLDETKQRGGS